MNHIINPEVIEALKLILKEKKIRAKRCKLAKDRKTLLITLEDDTTWKYEPTQEEMIEYWESRYDKEEVQDSKDCEAYYLEDWHHKERISLAKFHEEKWERVKLKEVTLPQKVQRRINGVLWRSYKKGRYTCQEIIRKYSAKGNSYTIVGEFEGIGLHVEANHLQDAVNKLLDNVRQITTVMNLQEMATV